MHIEWCSILQKARVVNIIMDVEGEGTHRVKKSEITKTTKTIKNSSNDMTRSRNRKVLW